MTIFYAMINMLQETLPFFILFLLPLRDRLRFSNRVNIPFVLFYSFLIFLFCIRYLLTGSIIRASLFTTTATFMATAVLLSLLLMKRRFIINIFILFIIKSYKDVVFIIVEASRFFEFLSPYCTEAEAEIIEKALVVLITFPFVYYFFTGFLKPAIDRTETLKAWRYIWFIPGMFFVVFYTITYPHCEEFLGSPNSAMLLPCIWLFSVFLIYYLILRMLNEAVDLARIEEKLRMAEIQAKLQKEQYEELQNQMEKARAVRHDLRHILLILDRYAEDGDMERFRSYIDQILSDRKND